MLREGLKEIEGGQNMMYGFGRVVVIRRDARKPRGDKADVKRDRVSRVGVQRKSIPTKM